jgi:hypothetical protein
MVRVVVAVVWMAILVLGPGLAFGEQAPDPQPPDPQAPKTAKTGWRKDVRVDQGGGIHITKHFGVVFGGIKQGSSIALGPAVSWESPERGYLQIKGGFSVRKFKLVQVRYDSPRFFDERSFVTTRLRWQDAPELPLFQRGPDSPDRHLTIGMTKSEWSAVLRTLVAPRTYLSVGSGVEGYSSKRKWADAGAAVAGLGALPDAPGLETRPWYVRSFAAVSYDTRFSPDYSRTGQLLEAGAYQYHDVPGSTQSFQRYEFAAVKLLPTFRVSDVPPASPPPAQYRGALSVFGRAWLSHTGTGQAVPFYLETFLGGGDYMRGYSSYRFHDRNALLFGTEYRYAVHKMADLAVLLEAGTVATTPKAFSLDEMAPSYSFGVRVHSKKSGAFRMDLAGGRDGWKVAVGVSSGS